ncbi:F0F1 ATP synthase subunit delta [Helcobacillus massiliensis]|uniref:ATP synthase subunit delta n=1 Tax=Helcobacillus massiliensis TaxID=521392 RepID=A0A839QVU1_9MICO|nr:MULTISPECIES: F0F1 ATP synthase subunit delta [Helcobacillus]MBB3022121.1 F-type H+-transporting ATPase subunit delta [Helcobacillus massiliensis]MCG7426813.1 F0F1 ATP synthase subunit delta [Helcobacillus sp. ACRRO]MCT1557353.1 F0F1 ATP synthase subunit delta [Helcobacillus massiliensis]MCT2037103.1 F0F1 ATP synthase subunit delta [Helcobacillus massiliensis]MCT2331638.1 F0F1 ATP synthase subunit delta [Helcobacillus massiliensis]
MRGTSAASLADVLSRTEDVVARSSQSMEELASELFQIAAAVDTSNQLVRLLSDPGRDPELKSTAVRTLIQGKASDEALELTEEVVRRPWSEQNHILDALEAAGASALLSQAEKAGRLETVEEELFQFSRLIDSEPELTAAFDEHRDDAGARRSIARRLLEGRVDPVTVALAVQAVGADAEMKASRRVLHFAEFAADRRRRLLAVVTSATELSDRQQSRLSEILAAKFGQSVQMNFEVSPDVIGGMRVQVGDDLYDATVLSRLTEARSRLSA